jgi:hypothetical protein
VANPKTSGATSNSGGPASRACRRSQNTACLPCRKPSPLVGCHAAPSEAARSRVRAAHRRKRRTRGDAQRVQMLRSCQRETQTMTAPRRRRAAGAKGIRRNAFVCVGTTVRRQFAKPLPDPLTLLGVTASA